MTRRTWDGSTGAYSSAADWAPTGVPVAGDTAVTRPDLVSEGVAFYAPSS